MPGTGTSRIRPCKPVLSLKVPAGPQWIHELKHDGFRIVAHKDGDEVRLWSRNGRNWSAEFVAITAAVMALPVTRIVLDREAVAGFPDFNALLRRSGCATACFYAFDLLQVGDEDLRGPAPASAKRCSVGTSGEQGRRCSTASTWTARTARRCFATPAPWGWRASSPSASTAATRAAGA